MAEKTKVETIREYEVYIKSKMKKLREKTRLSDDILSIIENTGLEGFYDGVKFGMNKLYVDLPNESKS